jgi:predicted ester cyclase
MNSLAFTSGADHRAVLERARDHWNRGDLSSYMELYDRDVVLHGYARVEPGLPNVRRFYEEFWTAFPGSQLIFEDLISATDKLACRFVIRAKHGGPFQGLPATGREIVMPGITILRFSDGRCVERWTQVDALGLLVQLGALPVSK